MGSTTHIVDETGAVQNRYEYDAWGNITVQEEAVPNRFKFTGQQLDPVTQQYYLRARFYSPVIARFTQEDIYRGSILNLYTYCENSPTYYVDPSGHQPECVTKNALKYIDDGMKTADAYKLAYAEYYDDQLKRADLSDADKRKFQNSLDRLNNQLNPTKVDGKTVAAAPWAVMIQAERAMNMDYDGIKEIAHIGDHKLGDLQVLAIYTQNDHSYLDVNPEARADQYKSHELLPFSAVGKNGASLPLNAYTSQNEVGSAHAELGAMYQAYQHKERGGDAELTVFGMPCCPSCRNTNVRGAAATLEVSTLTVTETGVSGTTRTLVFDASKNEMAAKKYGGVVWPKLG